ncbi:protein ITPRID2 [Cylas formicarius]|uniref:protein ITPRID2 n=1 Tax=Cylas formicarius TaxID=197179 RepID=UPI0029586D41|nr:protein ITPRID2 [Cylas formicarius]
MFVRERVEIFSDKKGFIATQDRLMDKKTTSPETMLMQTSQLTQQWLESMQNQRSSLQNIYATQQTLINRQKYLQRDSSVQSDDSHCSSVESVLELRKPDPEAVLLGLGFGPKHDSSFISRIPSRFLQPSKLITHIDINKFIEQYKVEHDLDSQSAPQSPVKTLPKNH